MNNIIRKEISLAKQHLKDVNMTYKQHFLHSTSYSLCFFCASAKAFVHAIFPSKFLTTSTDLTKKLNNIEEQGKNTKHTN